jgi:hypothetical protein
MKARFQRRLGTRWLAGLLLTAGWFCIAPTAPALPPRFGDLDADGQPTVLDVVRLVNYLLDTNSLRSDFGPFADVNQDGSPLL